MSQRDTSLACSSGCLFALTFVLSPAAFVVFWIYTGELKDGVLAGFVAFCVLLAGSMTFMTQVREPSAFLTWAPFAAGMLYTLLPDAIPFAFDDAAAMAAGAIATFALWLKRQPDVPKTAVLPLLFAAIYTLVGPVIPGPVDEMFVDAIAIASAVAFARRGISGNTTHPKDIAPPRSDASL